MSINIKIDERVNLFIKTFIKLKKKIDPNNIYGIDLNIQLLESSVREYFAESNYIKSKHSIEYTNASKRMSLTMHSVIQNKPIYVTKKLDALPFKILLINEIFAFILGVSHHSYRKCFRDKEAVENFLFLLHHKCIEPEAFAIVINVFDRVFKECKEELNASNK